MNATRNMPTNSCIIQINPLREYHTKVEIELCRIKDYNTNFPEAERERISHETENVVYRDLG